MFYYSIVPINDGYHYLSKDQNGNYVLEHKSEVSYNRQLLFRTSKEADEYIALNLDEEKYKSEFIWIEPKEYHFDVGM